MAKFTGKKMLFVGHGTQVSENIEWFKERGAYTIYVDHIFPIRNPLKKKTDEYHAMNIRDFEKVVKYAKDNNIDAIITSHSEESYNYERKLNEAIGNKYFFNETQWFNFVDKGNFRKLCQKYNVSSPKTYFIGSKEELNNNILNTLPFPIIVKPCDNAGAVGISVIKKKEDLNKGIRKAFKNSKKKRIIIEELLVGDEFLFTYVVQDGVCKLVSTVDKFMHKEHDEISLVPEVMRYPSQYTDLVLNTEDKNIKNMILSEGLVNCQIFFQGIARNNKLYIFESSLRIEGSASYFVNEHYNKQSFQDFWDDYQLKIKSSYDVLKDDPYLCGHKTLMYISNIRNGIIKSIEIPNDFKTDNKIYRVYLGRFPHEIIKSKNPVDHTLMGMRIEADNMEEAIEKIRYYQNNTKVIDIFNKDMMTKSFDLTSILK